MDSVDYFLYELIMSNVNSKPIKFSGIDSDSVRNHRIHAGNCIMKYMQSSNTPPTGEVENKAANDVVSVWQEEWQVALKKAQDENKIAKDNLLRQINESNLRAKRERTDDETASMFDDDDEL